MNTAGLRFLGLVALIVALGVLALLLPLHRIPDGVRHLGAWGPITAIAIGALLLAALVPRTAISIASGALFGPLGGGAVGLAAAMLAAGTTYAAGRLLGRDAIAAPTGDRLGRMDHWLARQGLLGVVVVRMLPIAPYGLVGYAYGTTSVRLRNYVTGSLIGATPSAFSYAAVGAAVVRPGAVDLVNFAPAALGLLVTAGAAVYWQRSGRRSAPAPEGTDRRPSAS
jgi:uncharacterized membrane protein YdjX (TVP38/TMEM64 family)